MSFEHCDDGGSPRSPVEPVELRADSEFQFRCHPRIACFNFCCKSIDVTLTPYDIIRLKRRRHNRAWREILLKKRSSGPTVGAPSPRSLQLFDRCSYDIDSFRSFAASEGFQDLFELSEDEQDALDGEDETLLPFSMRFLRQVLFGERTLAIKSSARARRIGRRRQVWAERKRRDAEAHRASMDSQRYDER